jgi:hypothetical protein
MGKPFEKQGFDAFTPTGSGPPFDALFPRQAPGGAPGPSSILTDAATQRRLRKRGAEYGPR